MAQNPLTLPVRKPIAVWDKPLKADFRALFVALARTAKDAAFGQWADAAVDLSEVAAAVGLDAGAGPEQQAWLLVRRALVRALAQLADEYGGEIRARAPADVDALAARLDLSLEADDFTLDRGLFERPAELPLLRALHVPFEQWLAAHGLAALEARAVAARLPAYFACALHEEWGRRPGDYAALGQALETPFTRAAERERAWALYAARLQRQVRERMFDEAFSLADVYVPLRAHWREPLKADERVDMRPGGPAARPSRRVIVDLERALDEWLERADPADALRVLSGGPGSGKSSVAKMIAARYSARGERVLLIPLHLFDVRGDLGQSVSEFVRQAGLQLGDPCDAEAGVERLLLILDGLDELAMQGRAAHEAAAALLDEVERFCARRGDARPRVRVLVGGRELVVQASRSLERRPRQVLHLLPYFEAASHARAHASRAAREAQATDDLDADQLLRLDQRDEWWSRLGALKGHDYQGLPAGLRRADLTEITAQPLLNYLLALSFDRGALDFTREVNLNQVYDDLLTAVYERGYAGQPHPGAKGLDRAQFARVLEEIALAAWHGDGRTTTAEQIEAHCQAARLQPLFAALEESLAQGGLQSGVMRLLTAFYFRQHGQRATGERTFEFTHKSFGEYLTARRLVRGLEHMRAELERRRETLESGWDEREALLHWAHLTGPTPMDLYLLGFVRAEVSLRPARAAAWQATLAALFGFLLRHGLPMERLPGLTYHEQSRQARNAEEALLACLNACARATEQVSRVDWPDVTALGTWLRRVQGQRTSPAGGLVLGCLSWLDCGDLVLYCADLHGADLSHSVLTGIRAALASLGRSDLSGANLSRADLSGADLSVADLSVANLSVANLSVANLSRANLSRANLSRANLSGANLSDADLSGANLSRADLSGAVLSRADLSGANLSRADLSGADLSGANLSGANLSRADLSGANLSVGSLSGANLSGANLSGANLSVGSLSGANLSGANLSGANLSVARGLDRTRGTARGAPAAPDPPA